jgi:hypothetical protein
VVGGSVSVTSPGAVNECGAGGTVPAGLYVLASPSAVVVQGIPITFVVWQCTRTDVLPTSSLPVTSAGLNYQVEIPAGARVTCVAFYNQATRRRALRHLLRWGQ